MKKCYLVIGFLTLLAYCPSIAQSLIWAGSAGGTSNDIGHAIKVDGAGNIYATGTFKGTADFDPGAATYNLTSSGDEDIFISKSDALGNFLWVKKIGGGGLDHVNSMILDESGNIYSVGEFNGTVDFDPGAGNYNLTSFGMDDIFISKLDSSGNFIWAKSMGSTDQDEPFSIVLDDLENVYITGDYFGTVDFDPGAGNYDLTAAGGYDVFILKLDASGTFIWAKSMGGTKWDFAYSIAIDGSGNVLTTGYFLFTADFDPGPGTYNLTPSGNFDVFISKLDASGNFMWADRIGGTDVDYGFEIATDGAGNVYIAGEFKGTVDFDPGTDVNNLTSFGTYDIFISKLDAAGNFVWVKRLGGSEIDYVNSMVLDPEGNIYTTGYFQGTADFDPNAGTANLTSEGSGDIFISKLDEEGNFVWAEGIGATANDIGVGMYLDSEANIYVTGYFSETVDFDPGNGTVELASAGDFDVFMLKLGNTTQTGIMETANTTNDVTIYPNPGEGLFHIAGKNPISEIKITNAPGQTINQFHPNKNNFEFLLNEDGVFFIQIKSDGRINTKTIVVNK